MITCDQHDYVEIACMYRFSVRLMLKAGGSIEGIALDTARNEFAEECIKISVNGKQQFIVLDTIAKMEVLTENSHFRQVQFDSK